MSVYRIEDRPTPHQWRRPAGEAGSVTWVVVHTPEAGLNAENTVRYLTSPSVPGRVGYHELVGDGGVIYRMARPEHWTGHAGVGTRIPNTDVRGPRVNYRTWSISINNVAGHPPSATAVAIAAQRVADMIIALGLADAGVVLGHREVSMVPGRRSDPTGVSMTEFRQMVHDALARRGRA